jgi:hypothetical protein
METQAANSSNNNNANTDFIYLFPTSVGQELLAAIVLACVLLVFRFQLLLEFNRAFLGGFEGDAGLYIWLSKSNLRDLFQLPWFNTQAFYPYTKTLAWSDNFILPSLALWPLLKIGLPFIPAWNLMLLCTAFLNGYLTYRLCFRLGGSAAAALLGGAVFMSLSTLSAYLGHPQLQFVFWFPLAVLLLFRFLASPALLDPLLIGLCAAGAFLCSVYYALFLIVFLASLLLASVVSKPHYWKRFNLPLLLIGGLGGFSPCAFFIWPYLEVRHTFGRRFLYESYYFAANALSYLSAPAYNRLYHASSGWSHEEARLFGGIGLLVLVALSFGRAFDARALRRPSLGFLVLFFITGLASLGLSSASGAPAYIAAIGSWVCLVWFLRLVFRLGTLERSLGFHIITNRGLLSVFLFAALALFLISLGPLADVTRGQSSISIFRVLYELLPGFNSIRAIGRIGVVVLFALCVCGSLVIAHYRGQGKLRTKPVVLLLAAMLAENFNYTYALQQQTPTPVSFGYLQNLSEKRGALLVLPFTEELQPSGEVKSWSDFAIKNVNYMNWAFELERPLVNGYSGQRSKIMLELPGQTRGFPDDRSLRALNMIAGLRYVIYVSKFDPNFDAAQFEANLARYTKSLKYIFGDNQGNYLIEFQGAASLSDSKFHLILPSYPDGILGLKLLGAAPAQDEKQAAKINLDIFALDEANRWQPTGSLAIPPDSISRFYNMHIPQGENRVRPHRLSFRVNPPWPLFLMNSSFEAAGVH